jgi:ATPases involved in chromosome partitioning
VQIVAIVQQKGGCGKTTITGNLVGELLRAERSVFAFDLDDQKSLTRWARRGQGVLHDRVQAMAINKQLRASFRAAVHATAADYVLLDCPPGFADPALEASLIAQLALIPVGPSTSDIDSAVETHFELRSAQKINPALQIAFVPTLLDRTAFSRDLPAFLGRYGAPVLPGITRLVANIEAYTQGLTVRECAPPARAWGSLNRSDLR